MRLFILRFRLPIVIRVEIQEFCSGFLFLHNGILPRLAGLFSLVAEFKPFLLAVINLFSDAEAGEYGIEEVGGGDGAGEGGEGGGSLAYVHGDEVGAGAGIYQCYGAA